MLVAVLSSLVLGGTASAQIPPAKVSYWEANGCERVITRHEYRVAVRRVYRFTSAGGDYRARTVKPRGRRRLSRMRQCSPSRAAHVARLRGVRDRKREWRFHRRIDRATPFGEWSIPPSIVMCESGGSYTAWNKSGSGASGAYQIMSRTWYAHGGGRYASAAAYAPPWAQHLVARRIWFSQGRGAWSC